METNTSLITLATGKLVKDKALGEAREQITEGQYGVDFTIRVVGTLNVKPDTEEPIFHETSIDFRKAFILALNLIHKKTLPDDGPFVESMKAMLSLASSDSETAIPDNAISRMLDEIEPKMRKTLSTGQTKTKKGTVTTKLTTEIVEDEAKVWRVEKKVAVAA